VTEPDRHSRMSRSIAVRRLFMPSPTTPSMQPRTSRRVQNRDRRPWIDHRCHLSRCLGVPRVKPPAPQAFSERSWTFLIEGCCRAAWYLRIVASHCSAGLCFIDSPSMPSSLWRIVRYFDISIVVLQARDEGLPVESTMARMRVSDDSGRK
jgi:hypothetical protein